MIRSYNEAYNILSFLGEDATKGQQEHFAHMCTICHSEWGGRKTSVEEDLAEIMSDCHDLNLEFAYEIIYDFMQKNY